jgi:hypothetical protein
MQTRRLGTNSWPIQQGRIAQVAPPGPTGAVMVCKPSAYRRALPRTPALPRRWSKGVISSPGQAKPYPGTSGDGKGSLRSTLRADPCRPRRTRVSSVSARPRR